MNRLARRLLSAGLSLLATAAQPSSAGGPEVHDLCPRVRFVGKDPGLNEVEKRLVCGDPHSDAWKRISLPQARDFMTAFLQRRGYQFPSFDVEGETLVVRIGTPTVVTRLTASGVDGIFDIGKRRGIVGRTLTPDVLNKTQDAVVFELQSRGYACPTVNVTADARTGVVHAAVDPGQVYRVQPIQPPRVPGLDPGVFERFQAFDYGAPLDIRLMTLTSRRIRQQALFSSAYYDVACTTAGPIITQHAVEAPPHLITLGIGADTEGLVTLRGSYQNARLGARASSAEVDAFANRREQSLTAFMHYYLRPDNRLYLMPQVFVRREDEIPYQAAHSQGSLSPAWQRDIDGFFLQVRGGPAVEYFNTIAGQGPHQSSWLDFVTHVEVRTHAYEYYENDPRQGWMGVLDTSSRQAGWYSAITAHRLRLSGEGLWNLGRYNPPIAILATRGLFGTVWVAQPSAAFSELPPSERFFMGGEANLRGFKREGLPPDFEGFLNVLYDGLELRAGDLLPWGLQPLVFVDALMGGKSNFHLDPAIYYSPGFGLRWATPFGALRATLGRGSVWTRGDLAEVPESRWQFYISYGVEF